MYFPECFAMNAGISAMYFLKPPKSFTDKPSTKYAFIPYLANLHQTSARDQSAPMAFHQLRSPRPPAGTDPRGSGWRRPERRREPAPPVRWRRLAQVAP